MVFYRLNATVGKDLSSIKAKQYHGNSRRTVVLQDLAEAVSGAGLR